MNKAILIGNLGEDPKVRTANGDTVCNLRVATNERYHDRDGNAKDRTDWHNVVVWGPQGEACGKYLRSGSKVAVEGTIQTRSYEKDGEKRYVTEIRAHHVEFLDRPEKAGDGKRDGRQDRQDDAPEPRRDDRRQSGPSDRARQNLRDERRPEGDRERRPEPRADDRRPEGAPAQNRRPW